MPMDKYSALWVSHSSMSDFLKCPRLYYLKNVYKDPKTGNKLQIVSPSLALGLTVHEVIEGLSSLPVEERFVIALLDRYEQLWTKVSGKRGGFVDADTEYAYKERGAQMLRRVTNNPGPLKKKAVKIQKDLPYYWVSPDDNIILCGKVDWLEYLPEDDSVHIIDFKTSKREEDPNSLQLPIYTLLVKNCQKRAASKASYWYLDFSDNLAPVDLPDCDESTARVLKIAKQILLAKKLGKLECKTGGCYHCKPFEAVLAGEAEFVGSDPKMRKDNYLLHEEREEEDSVIL